MLEIVLGKLLCVTKKCVKYNSVLNFFSTFLLSLYENYRNIFNDSLFLSFVIIQWVDFSSLKVLLISFLKQEAIDFGYSDPVNGSCFISLVFLVAYLQIDPHSLPTHLTCQLTGAHRGVGCESGLKT